MGARRSRITARLGRLVVGTLNRLMPKRRKAVLAGYPDVEDSVMEIARRLAARGDIEVVMLTRNEVPQRIRESLPVAWRRTGSLAGVFHYLTARFVFFTHGLYFSPSPQRSQIRVNVWHGMPFKRIGHLIGNVPPPANYVVATSQMFQDVVARCFDVPPRRVPVTGLPRNDVMMRASRRPQEIKAALNISGPGGHPRLITWLPTYRQAVRGTIRTDGVPHQSIFGMDDIDVAAFARFLETQDCVCLVKPHPMAAGYAPVARHDRVRVVSDDSLLDSGVSLYELVGASDMLITDASSVYVDFLLLDRPVVLAFPDFEQYRRTRGFGVEPVEDYLAGPVVAGYEELKAAICDAFLADPWRPARERIAPLFHKHADDGATDRLIAMAMRAAGEAPASRQDAPRPAAELMPRPSHPNAADAIVRRIQ